MKLVSFVMRLANENVSVELKNGTLIQGIVIGTFDVRGVVFAAEKPWTRSPSFPPPLTLTSRRLPTYQALMLP